MDAPSRLSVSEVTVLTIPLVAVFILPAAGSA